MHVMSRRRPTVIVPVIGFLSGQAIIVTGMISGVTSDATQVIGLLPAVTLGLLVVWRRPESVVGPALIALAAASSLTSGVEVWGSTFGGADAWPAARVAATVAPGVWVFHLAGFVLLCLTFPDGRLPGRLWAMMPWTFLLVAVSVITVIALDPVQYAAEGAILPGSTPIDAPKAAWLAVDVVAGVALLAVLTTAVVSIVLRYRRGDERVRLQLRWLMLGSATVPVLLLYGWIAEALGASLTVAYSPFLAALLIVLPGAIAFAILRHDLFDVDRLISGSVAWLLTTVAAAGVFTLVVVVAAELGRSELARGSRLSIAAAAFATALLLTPMSRRFNDAAARVFDRERSVMLKSMREFVRRVRDGEVAPEHVERVLRENLDDPELRVLLRNPGAGEYIDLSGNAAEPGSEAGRVPLTARGAEIGMLVLGRVSARRTRRARELAVEARIPIEVSRLRLELRRALDDAQSSRSRLAEAAAVERRRLERDLHDGAQQHILAVGMRLRSLQRQHAPGEPEYGELEAAVTDLEATVAELRRLANGVRPGRLDDGLDVAIRELVAGLGIPVELQIDAVEVPEVVATTAYFVVAESLTNTLKHAQARSARVAIHADGERLDVEVSDDGVGGVDPSTGLVALRDRVAAIGGSLDVKSPPGGGTAVRVGL